jgi:UDPglucose 6-dehydrogenase
VNPGDCGGPIKQKLEDTSGRKMGVDLGLAYSPEFVAQGNIINDFRNPDFVIIGSEDTETTTTVRTYYSVVTDFDMKWKQLSLIDAELAKIGLNTAVTAKMAVANQMGWICFRTPGADATAVLDAIGMDSRVGHKYFKPGPPDGGPCFPRDGRALKHYGLTLNVNAYIADSVDQFRTYQYSAITWHMGAIATQHFDHPSYALLGLTYKPGVDITEEAPGQIIKDAMDEANIPVEVYDPWVAYETSLGDIVKYNNFIVILTPHEEFKKLKHMDLTGKVVFDMWGMFDDLDCKQYVKFGKGDWLDEQA